MKAFLQGVRAGLITLNVLALLLLFYLAAEAYAFVCVTNARESFDRALLLREVEILKYKVEELEKTAPPGKNPTAPRS